MKRSLWGLVFLVLFSSFPGFATVLTWDGGGSQAGNGRVAEKVADVQRIYRGLVPYLDRGLRINKQSSSLTAEELRWLSNVRAELTPGHRRLPRLRFVSEKAHPEMFDVPGNDPAILWLDEKAGNEIWISADFLDWDIALEDSNYQQELAAILVAALAMRTEPETAATKRELFATFCQDFLGLIEQ